jgi:hypothetical protein
VRLDQFDGQLAQGQCDRGTHDTRRATRQAAT